MRLNLGCGPDVRPGYVNVDSRPFPGVEVIDLSKLPWPWADASVEQILMLDFLEHFPYSQTELIISEAWRILIPGGSLDIQVPDFEQCARAIMKHPHFPWMCHSCGHVFDLDWSTTRDSCPTHGLDCYDCPKCHSTQEQIEDAAVHRLYGGQDYPGNFHHTAFTEGILTRILSRNGFSDVEHIERNENGETYAQNWNFKLTSKKTSDLWGQS